MHKIVNIYVRKNVWKMLIFNEITFHTVKVKIKFIQHYVRNKKDYKQLKLKHSSYLYFLK